MYPVRSASQDQPNFNTPCVMVGAMHPTLGMVYWEITAPADDHLEPGQRSLTQDPYAAIVLAHGWREASYRARHALHIHQILADGVQVNEYPVSDDKDQPQLMTELGGQIAALQIQSRQTPSEFVTWLRTAPWKDCPAPRRVCEPPTWANMPRGGFSHSTRSQAPFGSDFLTTHVSASASGATLH